jgi:hypothetical protein
VPSRRVVSTSSARVASKRSDRLSSVRGKRAQLFHDLQNTLASLKLRVAILAGDPTCRWAQEENVDAIRRIVDEALQQVESVRSAPADDRQPKKRRGS